MTEEAVRDIRTRHGTFDELGRFSCARFAEMYGVSRATVQLVVDGTTWKHVVVERKPAPTWRKPAVADERQLELPLS